jgi:hypothetical protein
MRQLIDLTVYKLSNSNEPSYDCVAFLLRRSESRIAPDACVGNAYRRIVWVRVIYNTSIQFPSIADLKAPQVVPVIAPKLASR